MSIVIPRSVWQPQHDNGAAVIGIDEWVAAGKELWLHHSVTTPPGPDATLAEDCAHMRYLEQIGESNFGRGISYTWLVFPSGRVFEGHSIDRQGSHTYQRNNRARAICLVGNYEVHHLPTRMENAVAELLRELDATIDGPHSAVYATACPGQNARLRIPSINALALSGAPIGSPSPEETKSKGADDMLVKKLTGPGTGAIVLVSGGLVSMVDTAWAEETAVKVGMLGVSDARWNDLIAKSQEQEAIAPLLRQVGAKLDVLIELLTPQA